MAGRTVRATFALLGFGAAIFMLWFALDELTNGEPWFGLMVAACAPVLAGLGLMLPDLIVAPDSAARTRVIAHPFSWACQEAYVFLTVVAGGVYLAGWLGAIVGALVGGVLAWWRLESRRLLIATTTSTSDVPADRDPPSRAQWARLILKFVLLWLAFIVVAAGAGYALGGRGGAVAGGMLMFVVLLVTYAVTFYRWKRHVRRHGPSD